MEAKLRFSENKRPEPVNRDPRFGGLPGDSVVAPIILNRPENCKPARWSSGFSLRRLTIAIAAGSSNKTGTLAGDLK
jgi:hypothetical protein